MNEFEAYLFEGITKKANADTFMLESLTPQVVGVEPVIVTPDVKKKENELWEQWKKSNYNPTYLRPLHDSFKNLLFFHVNKWKSVNIPERLLQAEADKLFIEALKSYDPNKGAALSTHISYMLARIQRFVVTHQNMGRVVEGRAGKVFGELKVAKNLFMEEHGRTPTPQELAEKMSLEYKRGVSVTDAKLFMKEDRRDLSMGQDEADFSFEPSSNRMLMMILPSELSIEENQVYERLFGLNGSPKMDKGAIARQLRIHPSKVSRLIASIREKLEKYQ